MYLLIVSKDWKPGEDHELRVVFPLSQKVAIFEAALEYQILGLLGITENAMREIVDYNEKTMEEIIDVVVGDGVTIQKCVNRLLDTGEIIRSRSGVYRKSPLFGRDPQDWPQL